MPAGVAGVVRLEVSVTTRGVNAASVVPAGNVNAANPPTLSLTWIWYPVRFTDELPRFRTSIQSTDPVLISLMTTWAAAGATKTRTSVRSAVRDRCILFHLVAGVCGMLSDDGRR